VVEIHLARRYARDSKPPRWEIEVEELLSASTTPERPPYDG